MEHDLEMSENNMTAQPLCQETAPGKQDVNDESMGSHLSLINFYIYIFFG